jgi:hypothetical protein
VAGPPAAGGLLHPFDMLNHTGATPLFGYVEAFGYAHADVASVVLRLPDGRTFTAITRPAGFAGSDLRLWSVKLPDTVYDVNSITGFWSVTATARAASGAVVATFSPGSPP